MEITFQVSLYPLMQKDIRPAINGFISSLKSEKIGVTVHETSTIGTGDSEKIFDALKRAYITACKSAETIMVLTVANGRPKEEELAALNK